MSLELKSANCESFASFSNMLFKHHSSTDVFFDYHILAYLEKCFDLYYSTISIYDSKTFVTTLHHNTQNMNELYRNYYQKSPVHKKIIHDYPQLQSNRSIIHATKLLLSGYNESEYASFVHKLGVHYCVVLPFGPSGNIRLSLFKHKKDNDFSLSELKSISLIYSMLIAGFESFRMSKKDTCSVKNVVYDYTHNKNDLSCLSTRQLEIVGKISEGLSYKEVAEELFISINTVRNHLQNIFDKLGIHNQRQLMKIYLDCESQNVI